MRAMDVRSAALLRVLCGAILLACCSQMSVVVGYMKM